ncbi:hypothetical protein VTK26DRAFT_7002 [Humicola hyalothermophila]
MIVASFFTQETPNRRRSDRVRLAWKFAVLSSHRSSVHTTGLAVASLGSQATSTRPLSTAKVNRRGNQPP